MVTAVTTNFANDNGYIGKNSNAENDSYNNDNNNNYNDDNDNHNDQDNDDNFICDHNNKIPLSFVKWHKIMILTIIKTQLVTFGGW